MIETIRFRNDTQTRKRLMVPESFAHPAKGQLGMWALMVERYSQPGDLVLDPMAGVGSTLVAALMGRNVICVELEQHFVEPMRRSWEKMRQMPMLGHGMGQAVILRGDARRLPVPDASVGAAITSPPYANRVDDHGVDQEGWEGFSERFGRYTRPVDAIVTSPPYAETGLEDKTTTERRTERVRAALARGETITPRMQRYIDSQLWAGNMNEQKGYTRPVDAIVTSPPYEGTNNEDRRYGGIKDPSANKSGSIGRMALRYTRPVDAIVTSPPYEGSIQGKPGIDWSKGDGNRRDFTKEAGYKNRVLQHSGYTRPVDAIGGNVGNERGPQYWLSMSRIYAECYRVLRPGGIMALVLGNFVRDGLIVDLVSDTIDLCKQQGFQEIDHWQRVKWSLSFWRILQAKQGGPVIDREDVVAFRKPYLGSGAQDSLTEKVISPLEASPPVRWVFTSAKLTKGPSQQLPLSLPKEE